MYVFDHNEFFDSRYFIGNQAQHFQTFNRYLNISLFARTFVVPLTNYQTILSRYFNDDFIQSRESSNANYSKLDPISTTINSKLSRIPLYSNRLIASIER